MEILMIPVIVLKVDNTFRCEWLTHELQGYIVMQSFPFMLLQCDNWKERHYATLEIPTSLPELEDRKPDSYGYANGGGNSWNSRGSGTFHSKPRFGNQGNQGFKRKNDNNSNRDWNDRKRTKYGASA
eukprot:gene8056-13970_t